MSYPGGKNGNGTYQRIINEIPPHNVLVVPFLGKGGIVRNIIPAPYSVGFELDDEVIEWWKSQPRPFQPIRKKGRFWPDGKNPFLVFKKDGLKWLIEAANVDKKGVCFTWWNDDIANSPGDAVNLVGGGSTFIYCDPPYPLETRTKKNIYKYDWDTAKHIKFLDALCSLNIPIVKQSNKRTTISKCMIAVSSYPNDLYSSRLHNWRQIRFNSMTRGGLREEVLYMNYDPPKELHDYRYLGSDRRERERIKRKRKRWMSNFIDLPMLEQKAFIDELEVYQHKNFS